ncbi:hypothetical protein QBC42DRAFT_250019 [Cladorrhinum samala]|uniref:Uncharacterized protein n=1 Tax=Cladorrhinum samala TaxID=585594 RepID=A0AAV9HTB5_9PEZI|nr:hypothetical protein QBC42DRAFT_250019 [Cladorrhinum samala]
MDQTTADKAATAPSPSSPPTGRIIDRKIDRGFLPNSTTFSANIGRRAAPSPRSAQKPNRSAASAAATTPATTTMPPGGEEKDHDEPRQRPSVYPSFLHKKQGEVGGEGGQSPQGMPSFSKYLEKHRNREYVAALDLDGVRERIEKGGTETKPAQEWSTPCPFPVWRRDVRSPSESRRSLPPRRIREDGEEDEDDKVVTKVTILGRSTIFPPPPPCEAPGGASPSPEASLPAADGSRRVPSSPPAAVDGSVPSAPPRLFSFPRLVSGSSPASGSAAPVARSVSSSRPLRAASTPARPAVGFSFPAASTNSATPGPSTAAVPSRHPGRTADLLDGLMAELSTLMTEQKEEEDQHQRDSAVEQLQRQAHQLQQRAQQKKHHRGRHQQQAQPFRQHYQRQAQEVLVHIQTHNEIALWSQVRAALARSPSPNGEEPTTSPAPAPLPVPVPVSVSVSAPAPVRPASAPRYPPPPVPRQGGPVWPALASQEAEPSPTTGTAKKFMARYDALMTSLPRVLLKDSPGMIGTGMGMDESWKKKKKEEEEEEEEEKKNKE